MPAVSPQRLATDSTGTFLYVTNGTGASISQYTIGTDGTLLPLGAFTSAGVVMPPMGIAAAPDGSAMYVADFGSGLVISLSIQGGGTLTVVNSVASLGTNGPGQPLGIVVNPTGNFVYLTDREGGVVSAFAVGAGNVLTFFSQLPDRGDYSPDV